MGKFKERGISVHCGSVSSLLWAHTIFVHSALLILQDFFPPSALNCRNIFRIPLPFWKQREFGIPALILPQATQIVPVLCVEFQAQTICWFGWNTSHRVLESNMHMHWNTVGISVFVSSSFTGKPQIIDIDFTPCDLFTVKSLILTSFFTPPIMLPVGCFITYFALWKIEYNEQLTCLYTFRLTFGRVTYKLNRLYVTFLCSR